MAQGMCVAYCVALVGRPNVGKSRLFNCLSRSRRSIVHDRPGVTRDVVEAELANGATLLDTGGWGLSGEGETPAELVEAVERQVDLAIAMADAILFVLDGRTGPLPLDLEIAKKLRRTGKRVLPVVNKLDSEDLDGLLLDFFALGLGEEPLAISAEHRRGIDALESALFPQNFPSSARPESRPTTLALIGAPNVGKSSLANALLGRNRMIVSDLAGTTRDTVSGDFFCDGEDGQPLPLRLLDTAGLRPSGKVRSPVAYFSSVRARRALEEADVAVLVLDAVRGLTAWDQSLAEEVRGAGKCLAVAVNKWDLATRALREGNLPGRRGLGDFQKNYADALRNELFAWPQLPVLFVSAAEVLAVDAIPRTALRLRGAAGQKISTGGLNRALRDCIPEGGGQGFKIFYALQTGSEPITVRIYCNDRKLLDRSREAQLRRRLVEAFGLGGCALRLEFHGRLRRRA
jgi:GTP-binding protein